MEQMNITKVMKGLLMGILLSVVLTVGLIFLLAFLMYATEIGNGAMKAAIYVIYIISALAGGWLSGHIIAYKRFLWGLLNGLVYYLLVCIVSALTGGMTESGFTIQMTTVLMCLGGGMLGGMLA